MKLYTTCTPSCKTRTAVLFPNFSSRAALFCAIVGEEGKVFSIDFDVSKNVAQLKAALVAEHPGTIRCDATDLRLYLAQKDNGTWITENEVEEGVKNISALSALAELRLVGLSLKELSGVDPQEAAKGNGRANVLVGVPPNKRLRLDKTKNLESVPNVDIETGDNVTLPKALLKVYRLFSDDDLVLYCRPQVRELWGFLGESVVKRNVNGFIAGAPGTGKSVSTLCFAASLDRQAWNVIWIHVGSYVISYLDMGTMQHGIIADMSVFALPRAANKPLFVFLDGYKDTDNAKKMLTLLFVQLKPEDRLVVCSSLGAVGKMHEESDTGTGFEFFFMYSWTQEEYVAAIANQALYDKIARNLDATGFTDVNEDEDGAEEGMNEEDAKKYAVDLKFYYAGGSCRFMFQYPTATVIRTLEFGVEC